MIRKCLKAVVPAILAASLLSSCSSNGDLFLHNAAGQPVILNVVFEDFRSDDYEIEANDVSIVSLNFNIESELVVVTGDKKWCYVIGAIPTDWIKPGFSKPRAYARLSSDGAVHLYAKDSDEASFFEGKPPSQPPGFPLLPRRCSR